MSNNTVEIAKRMKELREVCGYTIDQMANDLNIDPATYQAYEEAKTNIPISAIYHVAAKFGVDFAEILTGTAAKLNTYHVVPKGTGQVVDRYPGYRFQDLAFRFTNKIMQPLLVTLDPSDKPASLVSHSGQEFNMVLEGAIILTYDGKDILLEAGDSVYFDPSHPHGQRCSGDKPAVFLTVISE